MHTMNNTVRNNKWMLKVQPDKGGCCMEKAYKTMKNAGAGSIAIGVVMIVAGVTAGILSIVNGARLLKNKNGLIF